MGQTHIFEDFIHVTGYKKTWVTLAATELARPDFKTWVSIME